MQRPPFKEVERSRSAFEAGEYRATKTANPEWRVGQGRNGIAHHPRAEEFSAQRSKVVYSAEELSAGENYKMIV